MHHAAINALMRHIDSALYARNRFAHALEVRPDTAVDGPRAHDHDPNLHQKPAIHFFATQKKKGQRSL